MKIWGLILALAVITVLVMACGGSESTRETELDPTVVVRVPPLPVLTPVLETGPTQTPTQDPVLPSGQEKDKGKDTDSGDGITASSISFITPGPKSTDSEGVSSSNESATAPIKEETGESPHEAELAMATESAPSFGAEETADTQVDEQATVTKPVPLLSEEAKEDSEDGAGLAIVSESGLTLSEEGTGDSVDNKEKVMVTVTYTGSEFVPKRVQIDVGKEITFFNESDIPFWPASNIHPTHEIYPTFDSIQLVPSDESWTFTFDRPGFWRYHNHLDPSQNGLVVVMGEVAASVFTPLVIDEGDLNFEELGNVSVEDAINLFSDDNLLARYVKDYGPANTLKLLSENTVWINVDCHQRAHILGRMAYEAFGALAFSLSGHECHEVGWKKWTPKSE